MITQEELKKILSYDPETGLFTRLIDRGRFKKGSVAGGKISDGYMSIMILGTVYQSHRLAWFYVHGSWPAVHIDHIDCNTSNNKILNLREATPRQNQMNRGKNKNNTSGFKGVSWEKRRGKWRSQIQVGEKNKFLGHYDDISDAAKAYADAIIEFHPEFGRC